MSKPKHDKGSPALVRAIQQSCGALQTIGELQDNIRGEHNELMLLIRDLLFEVVSLVEAGEKEYGENYILRGKELYEAYDAYYKVVGYEWYRKECT